MKNIKIKNGYYIKDFSSVSEDITWKNLVTFIQNNSNLFSSIKYDEGIKRVSVTFLNDSKNIEKIIKSVDLTKVLEQQLLRSIKLNLKFDKIRKDVVLSDENVENYKDYNEVFYEISCRRTNNDNNVFFHESSLIDYTKDVPTDVFDTCKYVLALVSFVEKEDTIKRSTQELIGTRSSNKEIFLCLDTKSPYDHNFVENPFLNYNVGTKLDISEFIKMYNDNSYKDLILEEEDLQNDIVRIYSFLNFKIAKSNFILPSKDIVDFLNFKSYVNTFLYNNFINSLYKSLEDIWPTIK